MIRSVLAVLLVATGARGAEPIEGVMLPLPAPGGWAMTPDGVTLIVSQPETGELVYFDTVAERESKRVPVDFKPSAMAVQGETLYVGAKGGSTVYTFEAKSGKQKKEIDLGGEAVAHLACHPTKGPVYASTATYQVFAINPATGKATKTKAVGNFLAVDPVDGSALFTGVQPPLDETEVFVQDLPGGKIKIFWDTWGARAFILKYAVEAKGLKLVSSQPNAAVNAYSLAITPDGKKVMMTNGGGWRPPVAGGTGGGYVCAAFSTEKLDSRVGEAPHGTNVAFHPVLNLAVLNQGGRTLQFFNPRSLIAGKSFTVAPGADARPLLVAFGAKGTKVVLWNGDNPANPREGLHFLPIELTAADRTALEKVYGKLPPPAAPPRPGVIAEAGFNDATGLNSDATPNSPYPLGKSNVRGGFGERGWQGTWTAGDKIAYVKDVVAEGDGAVRLTGTTGFARSWSKAQKGTFAVEMKVRAPKGGGGSCYLKYETHETTGPYWRIANGQFLVMNGRGDGAGDWIEVAPCKPDTWYAVRQTIDVEKRVSVFRVGGIGWAQAARACQ
jgi:DNA-binding beta-propeller fold protein YncE